MKYKVGDEVLVKGSIVKIECEEYDACPVAVGFDKGRSEWYAEEELIPVDKTYTKGLADAWELAKKVFEMSYKDRADIFDSTNYSAILGHMTAEETLAKIEAYEKEKEIKVGDVVSISDGTKSVVIDQNEDDAFLVLTENGCVECYKAKYLRKTGKHIDIESLIRQIGE